MQASVYFREPALLHEMRAGELFIAHVESLHECVCARALLSDDEVRHIGDSDDEELDIVIVACRVGPEEVGHVPTGAILGIHPNMWVTRVVPIERIAFREHMPLDEVPAVATEPRHKGEVDVSLDSLRSGFQAQPEFMSRR